MIFQYLDYQPKGKVSVEDLASSTSIYFYDN